MAPGNLHKFYAPSLPLAAHQLLIGIIAIKVEKQGQSSSPVDILVDIFNPYNSANGLN